MHVRGQEGRNAKAAGEILNDNRSLERSSMKDFMVAPGPWSKPDIFMFERKNYQGSSILFILNLHLEKFFLPMVRLETTFRI